MSWRRSKGRRCTVRSIFASERCDASEYILRHNYCLLRFQTADRVGPSRKTAADVQENLVAQLNLFVGQHVGMLRHGAFQLLQHFLQRRNFHAVHPLLISVTTGANCSGRTVRGIFFFEADRYGESRTKLRSGNLENFRKNSSFLCSCCLILHLPVRFSYVLSSLYSKNVHTEGEKSNNNGFWNFFFGVGRYGEFGEFFSSGRVGSGSTGFIIPYRAVWRKPRTVVTLLLMHSYLNWSKKIVQRLIVYVDDSIVETVISTHRHHLKGRK
jgi:hypothetical protein